MKCFIRLPFPGLDLLPDVMAAGAATSSSRLAFRPTLRAVLLTAVAGGCAWAGRVLGVFAFYSFAMVLATIVVVSWASALYGRRNHWTILRTLSPSALSVNDVVNVELVATAKHRFASTASLIEQTPWGARRLGLSAASPDEPQTISWDVPLSMRGRFSAGPGEIVRHDLFGLFRRRLGVVASTECIVWPRRVELNATRIGAHLALLVSEKRARESDSDDAATVRPYVHGDDPRSVNWKLSARTMSTGTLMVSTPERESSRQHVTIGFDSTQLRPDELELALSTVASLISALGDLSSLDSDLRITERRSTIHQSTDVRKNLNALALFEELTRNGDTPKPVTDGQRAARPTQSDWTPTFVVTGPMAAEQGDVTFRCVSPTYSAQQVPPRPHESERFDSLVITISSLEELQRAVGSL